MKIVIAGGTGFLGTELAKHFVARGEEIVILTRGKNETTSNPKLVHWDGTTIDDWTKHLMGTDVLINLTGKSVDCRYTKENKDEILRSRIDATKILGRAVELMAVPPGIWINASTATIYRHSLDKEMDEFTGEIGADFSMDVAKDWEESLFAYENKGVRKIALRTSLVIGNSGGVYPVLKRLAKFGLAGKMGSGTQRFSWIHISDVLSIIDFIISNEQLEGAINCTAPVVPTNNEFLQLLRESLGIKFGLTQPKFLLKIGALLIGTESELVLKSRWVIPLKLKDEGFVFKYPEPIQALNNLAIN